MIRINLFSGVPRGPGGASVVRGLVLGVAAVLSGGLVVGLVVLTYRTMKTSAAAPQETAAAAQPATVPAVPQRMPYSSMSLPQRVAYEIAFARSALEALSAAMPASLGAPSRVVLDSFSVVSIEGESRSKEAVAGLLSALRSDALTLRPKPYTTVAVNGGVYAYRAAAEALFVLGNSDSVMSRLPQVQAQSTDLKRVEQFAADAGVRIRKGLRYVSKQKAGRFQRLVYRMDAAASLADFTTFVRNVHAASLGCAFANVRCTGTSVSADIYLNAIE